MKNQCRLIRHQNGQALIEILVAMTVAILIISSVSVAILSALNNAEHSKFQAEATQYAQEGMDNMKAFQQLQESDYQTILNTSKPYCMESVFEDKSSSGNPPYDSTGGCDGKFDQNSTNDSSSSLCAKAKSSSATLGTYDACIEPQNSSIIFDRKIFIDDSGNLPCGSDSSTPPNPIPQIKVVVSWSDSKCTNVGNAYCNSVVLTQCFANLTQ